MDISKIPITPGALTAREIRMLVKRDDPLILEVGANCGQTTIELLKSMPDAIIHAFEPDPRAIAKFRHSLGASSKVRLHEHAIGAINGTVTFHQSSGGENMPDYHQGWDQSGSIRKPRTHLEVWPWVKFEKQIEVAIRTLDTWADQHQIANVDFIWADVQGAESDLIDGATKLLSSARYLYTEYSNDLWYEGQITLAELARKLTGFELIRRYEMDALFKNTLHSNE
ncbi:MAG: FkbM family methyltransferase [Betaproteobacteria bacterium]|nr:FkbM family methyltransferase [Betaproteobacteria bacterium]